MIKRLKYCQIDFKKYSECFETSVQRKYSASKEYLDITSNRQWELLVYKDYEAVMPVPVVRKYFFQFVLNPKLCQQIGIFSLSDSVEINDLFLQYLTKNYIVRYYAFNDKNKFSVMLHSRKNFIIYQDNYETVFKRYSPKRKRKLRQDEEIKQNSCIKENLSLEISLDFIRKNIKGANNSKNNEAFVDIFRKFYLKEKLAFSGYYYHGKLINLIAVYEDKNVLALLGTFNEYEFVKVSGASVLIDETLKKNIHTKDFDFEGGDISNVEEFFRGFRPQLVPYQCIIENSTSVFFKIFVMFFRKFFFF